MKIRMHHNDLDNYFRVNRLKIDWPTLKGLCELFANVQQPIGINVLTLLNAVKSFYHSTDSSFAQIRAKTITNEDIKKQLDDLSTQLKSSIEFKDNLPISTTDRIIMSDAISYCKQLLQQRLQQLKADNDRIYTYYDSFSVELQNILNTDNSTQSLNNL